MGQGRGANGRLAQTDRIEFVFVESDVVAHLVVQRPADLFDQCIDTEPGVERDAAEAPIRTEEPLTTIL